MDSYEFIKDAIVSGDIYPGKRLKEESLAKQLNISRTPIRQTLQKLEYNGLIIRIPNRGFIVREFLIEEIKQIYDLRALLEGHITSEACLHRTEKDISEMEVNNFFFEQAISEHNKSNLESIKKIQMTNSKFHKTIFKAAKNPLLEEHISKVTILPLIFRSYYWFGEKDLIQSLKFHKKIIATIKNKELDRAKVAMQEHIYQARDYILKNKNNIL